jgi:hypothetical protein
VRVLLDRALTIDEVVSTITDECSPSPQIEHLLRFLATSKRGVARGE